MIGSDLAKQSEFRVFRGAVDAGGFVRGLKVEGRAEEFSRKRIDELTEFVKHDFAAKGLAWFRVEPDGSLWVANQQERGAACSRWT